MSNTIVVTHQGIGITYNEDTNKFEFELRGRNRIADSLKLAKEAIDKPPPKDSKPFTRVKAYINHWGEFELGEVTSVVPGPKGDSNRSEAWVSINGERSKVRSDAIFLVNDHNTAIVKEITECKAKFKSLNAHIADLMDKLKPLKVEAE